MNEPVKTLIKDSILEVTIDRPKANAIDAKTSIILGEIFSNFRDDPNLKVAIITPDKEIVENANKLSPAYIVFDNYEIILKWNRSLRFALAVCTLKDRIKNEL